MTIHTKEGVGFSNPTGGGTPSPDSSIASKFARLKAALTAWPEPLRSKSLKGKNRLPEVPRDPSGSGTGTPAIMSSAVFNDRLRRYVVIEVHNGSLLINYWKCGDLVHYVNAMVDTYHQRRCWGPVSQNLNEEERISTAALDLRQSTQGVEHTPLRPICTSALEAPACAHCGVLQRAREPVGSITGAVLGNGSTASHRSVMESTQARDTAEQQPQHHHYHYHHYHYYPRPPAARESSGRTIDPRQPSRLTYRDLRQIFTDGFPVPSIEVRRHCIIICFPPVSCILMADRVFLLQKEEMLLDPILLALQKLQKKHIAGRKYAEAGEMSRAKENDAPQQRQADLPSFTKEDLSTSPHPGSPSAGEATPARFWTDTASISREYASHFLSSTLPIEFEALEILVSAAFSHLETDIAALEMEMTQLEGRLKKEPTDAVAKKLQQCKNRTRVFSDRVRLYDKALDELMREPEELLLMELTRLKEIDQWPTVQTHRNGDNGRTALHRPRHSTAEKWATPPLVYPEGVCCGLDSWLQDEKEDIFPMLGSRPDPDLEILLEYFDQEIELVWHPPIRLVEGTQEGDTRVPNQRAAMALSKLILRQKVSRLEESIKDTEQEISYSLSLSRNRLLRWDVGSGMTGVGIGMGTLVSGIFGMNLESGWEKTEVAFSVATIGICLITALSLAGHLTNMVLPLALLRAAKDHPVMVELKNGDTLSGILAACDGFMNLNLRDLVCTARDGDRFWRIAECYVRGNNIKYFRLPEDVLERATAMASAPGTVDPRFGQTGHEGGRGRGRGRSNPDWQPSAGRGRGRGPGTLDLNGKQAKRQRLAPGILNRGNAAPKKA